MASTALFVWMASVLYGTSASLSAGIDALICALSTPKLGLLAVQLGDLDTGLGNEVWFLLIIAVVAVFMYFVYRGPKHM